MTDHSPHLAEKERRGALVLRTQLILLLPLLASAVASALLFASGQIAPVRGTHPPDSLGPLAPIVLMVVFFSALIILVRLGRPTASALVLIGVWTLLTTASALRFGVTTYFPALLVLPICAAGLLIDRIAAIALAALASVLVASGAWLEWQGVIQPPGAPPAFENMLPLLAVGFWLGLFWAVAALTALLAGGMQTALRRSAAQAEELRLLSEQLEQRVDQQTQRLLTREREAATLEERNRLAREIHDTLAQGLAGIVVQLGALRRAMDVAPGDVVEHLGVTEQMAREALAEARRSVWNLRAAALEQGGLSAALRTLAARRPGGEPEALFREQGEPYPLAPDVEAALLRVAQEALANTAKHAQAHHVEITLRYQEQEVQLIIRDNGIGFPRRMLLQSGTGMEGHFGLLGMRERLQALGGRIELDNDAGAVVTAIVPQQGVQLGNHSDSGR